MGPFPTPPPFSSISAQTPDLAAMQKSLQKFSVVTSAWVSPTVTACANLRLQESSSGWQTSEIVRKGTQANFLPPVVMPEVVVKGVVS